MKAAFLYGLTAALIMAGHSEADAVLTVAPSSSNVAVGQQFTVAIDVTGPTVIHNGQQTTSNVSDLASFQFDLAFNCTVPAANPVACQPGASVLKATSVSEGSFLRNGGANITFFEPGSINNGSGQIMLIGDVGVSGVTGSGDLVDITFQALTAGTTSIAILANSDLQLYDSNFNPIVVADSVTTSPGQQTFPTNQFLSTSVTVATPEPASTALFISGIAALFVLTRRYFPIKRGR